MAGAYRLARRAKESRAGRRTASHLPQDRQGYKQRGAEGLWQKSTPISESEARPGDLVFFEGTYDTPGRSHVGIYVGGGMMISAGDPVKYSNIHSSYWEKHLSGFGRISKE